MGTINVTIRMDEDLKLQADELFADLGLSFTAAVTAFTKQAVREQKIPFMLSRDVPNREILEIIRKQLSEKRENQTD